MFERIASTSFSSPFSSPLWVSGPLCVFRHSTDGGKLPRLWLRRQAQRHVVEVSAWHGGRDRTTRRSTQILCHGFEGGTDAIYERRARVPRRRAGPTRGDLRKPVGGGP